MLFLVKIVFTFILGIVTVGGSLLACIRQVKFLDINSFVIGIADDPIGPVKKSHLKASITIITIFLTVGLYSSSFLILENEFRVRLKILSRYLQFSRASKTFGNGENILRNYLICST